MKINIGLDYEAIIRRINSLKGNVRPGEWAKRVGVSIQTVSNVHGKIKQKPSLEYIIAVARAEKKPIEYLLYGELPEDQKCTDLISRFANKGYALEINRDLAELEHLSPEAFKSIGTYIKGLLDGVRFTGKDRNCSNDERRKGERRINNEPNHIPDSLDRRSGLDRRKVFGGNL